MPISWRRILRILRSAVNAYCVTQFAKISSMKLPLPKDRLKWARERHGKFETPTDAAREMGWTVSTYLGHENGDRVPSRKTARKYAKAYGVRWEWVLEGEGNPEAPKEKTAQKPVSVPLVGYASAGTEVHFLPAGDLGEVPFPEGGNPQTVAVEIRGDSLGPLFDRWLVYYDAIRNPVTADLYNRLCVLQVEDGRIMVKRIKPGSKRGLFHLFGNFSEPLLDVPVEWAAPVRQMVPRTPSIR